MKIIGFTIEEIHGKKSVDIPRASINTDVVFTDVDKAKFDVLKDSDCLRASFKFSIIYTDPNNKAAESKNELKFVGSLLLSVSKDDAKEFLKTWKNKELPKDKTIPLYNYILKRCSVRALQLEEELGLQPHIPFPQVRPNQQNSK
ncbi:MAG: hypothetical protein ACP5NS_02355 [Candidatus Pacearchaeota archaeon]